MNEKTCRQIVRERAQDRCEMTGIRFSRHSYHHRLKRSQGGKWTPENVVLVQGTGTTGSHGWIEANPDRAWEHGFHVRPWEDPADVPILLHGFSWVKLDCGKPQYHSIDEGI